MLMLVTMEHTDAAVTGRLLVVDDNELNRDMLSRRLSRLGHDVACAAGGAEALELIDHTERPFDIVLLDVMMPDIDGLSVLRHIREKYSTTALPVIMATAKDSTEDIVSALQIGANDYVTKPLQFAVVAARISVSGWSPSAGAVLVPTTTLSGTSTPLQSKLFSVAASTRSTAATTLASSPASVVNARYRPLPTWATVPREKDLATRGAAGQPS